MKPAIYIETTIPSYLTARPAGDVVLAAHHQLTRRWWKLRLGDFRAYTSQVVLDEAAEGNPGMARKRLAFLRNLPLLATNSAALFERVRAICEAAGYSWPVICTPLELMES